MKERVNTYVISELAQIFFSLFSEERTEGAGSSRPAFGCQVTIHVSIIEDLT